MPRCHSRPIAVFLCVCLVTGSALAGSSAASSVSESIGTSVGSVSGSLQNSSASSSRPTNVADGDYRVIEIAADRDRPDHWQVTLQPVDDAAGVGFVLRLPASAAMAGALAVGRIVTARQRPYGIEFADAGTRRAFFLVLHDEWYRDLPSHPVAL